MTNHETDKERTGRIINMVLDHLEQPDIARKIYGEIDQMLDEMRDHQQLVEFHRAIQNTCQVHRKENSDGHQRKKAESSTQP